MRETLLQVEGLKKDFRIGPMFRRKTLHAVRDVSFTVGRGETLGIVGESGCGKSTTGRLAIRLLEPTDGTIRFKGRDLCDARTQEMRALRQNLQIIFQDPFASLDPRMTVEGILREPLKIQRIGSEAEQREKVASIMAEVGLLPSQARRYPHEFSGGQRQRIGIARSLILRPELIVADEPVSALDVSVQAQVLNLMQDIQQKHDISYIFISHDLSVVKHICDRVAVMYLGTIVETSMRDSLYAEPLHPYTKSLMSAIPGRRRGSKRITLKGDIPDSVSPPSGCAFHTRCPSAMPICREREPRLSRHGEREVACHLYN